MKDKILLAVDGSAGGSNAIDFAIARAKRGGDGVVVSYVIEWSPYSFNTPEENAQRHKRREEELERANSKVLDPVLKRLKEAGVEAESEVRHGHIAETLIELAEKHQAVQIVLGRRGDSNLKTLLFGSVAANLVQTSPVPVTVVP